jgi:hypothetical protein
MTTITKKTHNKPKTNIFYLSKNVNGIRAFVAVDCVAETTATYKFNILNPSSKLQQGFYVPKSVLTVDNINGVAVVSDWYKPAGEFNSMFYRMRIKAGR